MTPGKSRASAACPCFPNSEDLTEATHHEYSTRARRRMRGKLAPSIAPPCDRDRLAPVAHQDRSGFPMDGILLSELVRFQSVRSDFLTAHGEGI